MVDEKNCRRCGRKMQIVAGGVLPDENGNYPENFEDRKGYLEYKCVCGMRLREENHYTWSEKLK